MAASLSSVPWTSAGGQRFLQVLQNENSRQQDFPNRLWELRDVLDRQHAQVN
jgi:hypothetical protein